MNTKSVSIEEANAFVSSDNWAASSCGRCGASLERGGGYRESAGNESRRSLALKSLAERGDTAGERHAAQNALGVDIICHDCIYTHDAAEFKLSGVLSGSSLATTALLRYDLEVYRPFFDAECMLTPTLQAVWEVYRTHPVLNDSKVKRAILVNTTTAVSSRVHGARTSLWSAPARWSPLTSWSRFSMVCAAMPGSMSTTSAARAACGYKARSARPALKRGLGRATQIPRT